MEKLEYRYFILRNTWLARLKKGCYSLDDIEFFQDGKWELNTKLNLMLNDCIMDYGDYRWYEYDEISEEKATAFINLIEEVKNGISHT